MKVVHLEDNPADAEYVREVLMDEFPGSTISVVDSREHFLREILEKTPPDIVISDFSLPAFDGLSALRLTIENSSVIPFVFLSGSIGEERAIAAVRAGAYDYVLKDNMARLPVVIRRAMDEYSQRRTKKEGERRLLELAGIIERANEAIVVSDLNGCITLWNNGAARLYGVEAADAVGRPAEEVLSRKEVAYLKSARDSTQEKGEWQRELRITTRDGRELVVDFRMSLVRDASGNPSARLSIATDITEKKKLEEQFLRAQRLESLGLLASGIAHDLNNVLAPVLMAAPLLRQHVSRVEDLHVLDILEKSAERGAGLVRQILGFARGVGGGQQVIQVRHLLNDFAQVIKAGFPKNVLFEEEVVGELWPIRADPTQVHQILLNLAVNARDAMAPRGGILRIRVENRTLRGRDLLTVKGGRPGAFLVITVSDTGSGMTPEVLNRIWEPFFTTKGEGKGTGLGLSTVRGIAAAHNGFVTVDTQVGRGTSFSVYLPAEATDGVSADDTDAPRAPRGSGELVMVVDDETDVSDVTSTILTRHGYRVVSCRDGVEAIGIFTENKTEVRLVISDLRMPNLDGESLALVLRRLNSDIRILFVTGMEGDAAGDEAGAPASTGKLKKPFTAEALLNAVHRVLHGVGGPSG